MFSKNKPLIVGLTGSIGMGKTTVAKMFARRGAWVFDADGVVRTLLAPGGGASRKMAKLFPAALTDGKLDRVKVWRLLFQDETARRQAEEIIHPLVWKARRRFLREAKAAKADMVVLDVPLLFETGEDQRCDVTICVTASVAAQKARALARPHMTAQKLKAALAAQMPDREKRARADFVLRTDKGLAATRQDVKKLWTALTAGGEKDA